MPNEPAIVTNLREGVRGVAEAEPLIALAKLMGKLGDPIVKAGSRIMAKRPRRLYTLKELASGALMRDMRELVK